MSIEVTQASLVKRVSLRQQREEREARLAARAVVSEYEFAAAWAAAKVSGYELPDNALVAIIRAVREAISDEAGRRKGVAKAVPPGTAR